MTRRDAPALAPDADADAVRVLVLDGGPDRERPVSLRSGANVVAALAAAPGIVVAHRTVDRPDRPALAALVAETGAEVVLPMLHGPFGEGGPLQSMLEALGVAFVGADARACTLAMDKDRTKARVAAAGFDTPPWLVASSPADLDGIDGSDGLDAPLVLKPVDDGSSVDLVFCDTVAEAQRALPALLERRDRILVERRIIGREITIGMLGRPGAAADDPELLPMIEIVPAGGTYDYDAKYERDDTGYRIGDAIPDLDGRPAVAGGAVPVAELCRRAAIAAWRALAVRDLARVDLLVGPDPRDPGAGPRAWFLELNTMPGFTDHSLLPMAARAAGLDAPALAARLVALAAARRRQPTPAIG